MSPSFNHTMQLILQWLLHENQHYRTGIYCCCQSNIITQLYKSLCPRKKYSGKFVSKHLSGRHNKVAVPQNCQFLAKVLHYCSAKDYLNSIKSEDFFSSMEFYSTIYQQTVKPKPKKSNLKLQRKSEHSSKMKLIQLEPVPCVNTDEVHILISNGTFNCLQRLDILGQRKVHWVLGEVQIRKSTHLAGEGGS